MNRRAFTRTLVLGGLGAIFVPRYERWFRPLVVTPKALTVPWPEAAPGDLATIAVWSKNGVMRVDETLAGWTLLTRRADHQGDVAMYYRMVGQEPRTPVALPKGAQVGSMMTFRNAVEPTRLNVVPSHDGLRPVMLVGSSSSSRTGRLTTSLVTRG